MSISDLYSSGEHRNNIGHFANIVKLALADGNISHEEQVLLDRLAKNLNIDADEYKAILREPAKYPISPPSSYEERIERLYNLTRMVYADHEVLGVEVNVLNKIAIGLGFPGERAKRITEKAIYLVINNYDLDGFTENIKGLKF